MPVLSRLAFAADVPIEVKATLITEESTKIAQMAAVLVGKVKPAPEFSDVLTAELRPLVAAYCEGLNCNIPSYQALAFCKIIEGVSTFHTNRQRSASWARKPEEPSPMLTNMPSTLDAFPNEPEWSKERFKPHLGKSFQEVREAHEDAFRHAIAHLTPGRDIRVLDYIADVEKCREAVPVLRYVARALILGEVDRT